MRVSIPDALSAGVVDLRDYGEGQVPVEEDAAGRYVDVDGQQAAQAVADAYGTSIRAEGDATGDSGETGPSELPPRDGEFVSEGKCGYHDPETMDAPCARPAGWGREADGGLCRDHHSEDG